MSDAVDSWLDLSELVKQSDPTAVQTSTSVSSNIRVGLGFQSSGKPGSKLAVNNKSRKRKIGTEDDFLEELHGVVEEEVEESRTQAISSTNKKTVTGENAKKSKNSGDNIERVKINSSSNAVLAILRPAPIPTPRPATAVAGDGADNSSIKKKHKKIKTRSKQKNIRRDTRPVECRPEHLKLNRTSYRGRSLTPETRTKLNLPLAKSVKHNQNM